MGEGRHEKTAWRLKTPEALKTIRLQSEKDTGLHGGMLRGDEEGSGHQRIMSEHPLEAGSSDRMRFV